MVRRSYSLLNGWHSHHALFRRPRRTPGASLYKWKRISHTLLIQICETVVGDQLSVFRPFVATSRVATDDPKVLAPHGVNATLTVTGVPATRGLHSSTFRLNVSTFSRDALGDFIDRNSSG